VILWRFGNQIHWWGTTDLEHLVFLGPGVALAVVALIIGLSHPPGRVPVVANR
jgi:hypothetical protein